MRNGPLRGEVSRLGDTAKDFLLYLGTYGDIPELRTPTALCKVFSHQPSSVHDGLRSLESPGLINKVGDQRDGRVKTYSLTEKGKAARQALCSYLFNSSKMLPIDEEPSSP